MLKHFIILFFGTISVWAGPTYDELVKELPKDVIAIIDRRIGCNGLSVETPDDTSDAEAVDEDQSAAEKKKKELKCSSLDTDEKVVRIKYKKKDDILEALDESKKLTPVD